jgi:hypothetical protein
MGPAFSAGFMKATREYDLPIRDQKICHRNYYHYDAFVMAKPESEEEARQIGEAAEAGIKPELGRLLERWHGEHLPAISAHLDRLKSMEVRGLSRNGVLATIDEADAIHQDLWTIHFRIAHVMLVAIEIFSEFYTDLFGGDDADAHSLLVGANSKSVMAGIALSDLKETARELGLRGGNSKDSCRDSPLYIASDRQRERVSGERAFLPGYLRSPSGPL